MRLRELVGLALFCGAAFMVGGYVQEQRTAPDGGAAAWQPEPPAAALLSPEADAVTGTGAAGGAVRRAPQPSRTLATPRRFETVAIASTTVGSGEKLRQWLTYHRKIGVTHFYLFCEHSRADFEKLAAELAGATDVRLIPRWSKAQYKGERPSAKYCDCVACCQRALDEWWLGGWLGKPCNAELFVRQSLNLEDVVPLALRDGVDWIAHVDNDELLYPGFGSGASQRVHIGMVLDDVNQHVDTVVFPNWEGAPESDRVTEPFKEVTLFKKNTLSVSSDAMSKGYGDLRSGKDNYFLTYANGKAAARVQPGLRCNGAHRWQNRNKQQIEITLDSTVILHYVYATFSTAQHRGARGKACGCNVTPADAARCFILDFDQKVFLKSSLLQEPALRAWYRKEVVWDNAAKISAHIKDGLLARVHAPQLLLS